MRRYIFAVLLMVGLVLTAPLMAKEKPPMSDMSGAKNIYLGWVEMSASEFHRQGYASEAEYRAVLDSGISSFIDACKADLTGREITVSKSNADGDAKNSDLYIKFTDAYYDRGYRLHIAVHFIDPKTNAEIGTIPLKVRGSHFCTLAGCIKKEFDEVGDEIAKAIGAKKK